MKRIIIVSALLLVAGAYALPGTAAYVMENNTATLVVDSVNSNDMTKEGGLSVSTDVPFSYSGNLSLAFNSSDGYDRAALESMATSYSLRNMGRDFTVEMWIKPTSGPVTPSDPEIHFFSLYSWTSGEYLQIRTQTANNNINVYFGNKVNTGTLAASLAQNQWQHLAVTVNDLGTLGGIDLAVYLNGNPVGSKSGTSPMTNTGWKSIYLGTGDSRYLYNGLMDEVVITPGVVDLATIQLHAAQSIVPEPTTLILLAIGGFGLIGRQRR